MHDIEKKAYRDALAIAWVGASNPIGVALTIHETLTALRDVPGYEGTRERSRHPAVQAMVGHLDYLCGLGLGPPSEVLNKVREMATE